MVSSGFVSDLDFETVFRLRENDARGDDMGRIRALGFGPYTTREVIMLRQNDVTADRIRNMKQQGFENMSLEQILKLRRSGVI